MSRGAIILLALLALTVPRLAYAQSMSSYDYDYNEEYGPPPYDDVEDGQALRIAGYILAPFGYALEWGLTRPLHHVATDTALAPVLSGDTDVRYFGETSNADLLPPNTFMPFRLPANPNAIDSDSTSYHPPGNALPPVPRPKGDRALPSYPGQPALH
jgi:hypothetical protein